MTMKFDDILEHHVGEFGPYQKFIYVLVSLPAVASAFMTLLPVFILVTPKHRCKLPGMENDTYKVQSAEHQAMINASIPYEDAYEDGEPVQWSSCQILQELGNGTRIFPNQSNVGGVESNCNEWVFDNSEHVSVVTEFELVCQHTILKYHILMIIFLGCVIGACINGVLADRYGRKVMFLLCLLVSLVVTVVQIAVPQYKLFLAMRFIHGFSGSGVFSISFVYVMEMVGPNYRMFAGIFFTMFWCAGMFILVATAYWIRHWKTLMAATSAPCLLFFLYIWLIPKSPRWLMSVNKTKEAEKVLRKIAKSNKREMPGDMMELAHKKDEQDGPTEKDVSGQIWGLFTHRVLLLRIIVISINRFALDLAYFGVSLNIDHLSGNMYRNYTLSSAVETVSIILILMVISKWGRKTLYSSSMILGAVGLLVSTFPVFVESGSHSNTMWSVGLVMLGKFGVSAGYAVIYVYNSEVFPTSVRASAMAICYIFGMLGGLVSPYVVEASDRMAGHMAAAFPMLVFGAVCLIAGLLSLLLPETKDRPMPENFQDAIRFGGTVSAYN